jgi:hypothetical protein
VIACVVLGNLALNAAADSIGKIFIQIVIPLLITFSQMTAIIYHNGWVDRGLIL